MLPAVLDSVIANNPGLKQFKLKTRASQAMARAAGAWEAPQVGFGLTEFPYPGKAENQQARKMLMLHVEQMFPNFSDQRAEQRYYESFRNLNQDDYLSMKNALCGEAKAAYFQAVIAIKRLEVIREESGVLQLLIKTATSKLAYSSGDLPDIYEARARLSDLYSQRLEDSSLVLQSSRILNYLMDRPQSVLLGFDTLITLHVYQESPLLLDSAKLERRRSDIGKISNQINTLEFSREEKGRLGKPSFGVSYDNMRMSSGMYMFDLMALIKLPLVPWSSRGYREQQLSIGYEEQALEQKKTGLINEAVADAQKTLIDLQTKYQELDVLEQQVIPAYRKAFQANLDAYRENTGSIYQTLMTWQDLLAKKMDYLDKLSAAFQLEVLYELNIQQYD